MTTNFTYDNAYLARPGAWAVSPELSLPAVQSKTTGLPGAISDSTPDRWGRSLIKRHLLGEATAAGKTQPEVKEFDYLLGVNDFTRHGALRYTMGDDDTYLSAHLDVPKLIELPKLLDAANIVSHEESGTDDMAAIKELLDAGSGALGGARPKVSVRDNECLSIAKFPHYSDEWDVMTWEMVALDLAERSGIQTPHRQLQNVGGHNVLILQRFDRVGDERVAYVSAMTLLQTTDGMHHDYLEIAEALGSFGSRVNSDLEELWRRIAFSILVNNTDDHLRNHGFLHEKGGWTLSPIFDVNPNPETNTGRKTSINYVVDRNKSKVALYDLAEYFGLSNASAERIWGEVRDGVSAWKDVAHGYGVSKQAAARFTSAFELL